MAGQALTQWLNDARLLDVSLADGTPMLAEHVQGVEGMLGMPLPATADALLPNPLDFPTPFSAPVLCSEHEVAQSLFTGFRFEVTLLSDSALHDVREWLGQPILVHLQTPQGKRRFHGQITNASNLSSNGGFARYHVVFEPWLAALRHERHNRVFIDTPLTQVIEQVCGILPHAPVSFSADCEDINLPLVTQYGETDWQFIQRLLMQHGLTGYWTHVDGGSATDADHHLYISRYDDGNQCRHPSIEEDSWLKTLKIHRNAANETTDNLIRIHPNSATQVGSSDWQLYDTRQRGNYTASSSGEHPNVPHAEQFLELVTAKHLSNDTLDSLANRWQDGQLMQAQTGELHSRVRMLQPAACYPVLESPHVNPDQPIQILSVVHEARNNLRADFAQTLYRAFSEAVDPVSLMPMNDDMGHGVLYALDEADKAQQQMQHYRSEDKNKDNDALSDYAKAQNQFADERKVEFYRNHALWIPQQLPSRVSYLNNCLSDYLSLTKPHPCLQGQMTAIVTGDHEVQSDRNHRVKIQFHWQRGDAGHQNLDDEAHTHAPASGSSSLWVPVASNSTGDGMGSVHIPRQGQEVIVDFVNGDIDQPVIVGSVYNGTGQDGAQGNQANASPAHIQAQAPVWFGTEGDNHIDGIKSQSISTAFDGHATKDAKEDGYNQLTFDHHAQGQRMEAYSTAAQSQLQLGQVWQHTDHAKQQARGSGFALETHDAGSVRGSKGLLLTSETSPANKDRKGNTVHNTQAQSALEQAQAQQDLFHQRAKTHAPVGLKQKNSEACVSENTDCKDTAADISPTPWQQPHTVISAGHSTGITTPKHMHYVSGGSHYAHASKDSQHQSQEQLNYLAVEHMHLFANQQIQMTAAHGDVQLTAHQNELRADAKQTVSISSRDSITIQAPSTIKLTAAGSGIELSGGNITVSTSGTLAKHAGKKIWTSGGGSGGSLSLKKGELQACEKAGKDKASGGSAV